jgi:serine/threonine-protein kinase
MIKLTVIAGPHQGSEFRFAGHDTFLVGRSKHAHFQLPAKDKFFSRIHFMIEVNPPHCRLVDMGSNNGTYVNGQKVLSADLHDGDQIRAGHSVFQLQVLPELVETATGPGESPSVEAAATLAGYHVVRELGRGGMGIVFLVERLTDRSPAAMRIVRPSGAFSSARIDSFLAVV